MCDLRETLSTGGKHDSNDGNMMCIMCINDDVAIINPTTSNVNRISGELTNVQRLYGHSGSIASASKQSLSSYWSSAYDRSACIELRAANSVDSSRPELDKRRNRRQLQRTKHRPANNKWIKRCWLPIAKHFRTHCTGALPNPIDLDVCPERTGSVHSNYSPETHPR